MSKTVPFKKKDVRDYLDACILKWRFTRGHTRSKTRRIMAIHYIDAFQSVRISIFGELLSSEDGEEVRE